MKNRRGVCFLFAFSCERGNDDKQNKREREREQDDLN